MHDDLDHLALAMEHDAVARKLESAQLYAAADREFKLAAQHRSVAAGRSEFELKRDGSEYPHGCGFVPSFVEE